MKVACSQSRGVTAGQAGPAALQTPGHLGWLAGNELAPSQAAPLYQQLFELSRQLLSCSNKDISNSSPHRSF